IDRAERTIYIENQFLTATSLARRLARRMRERPKLEVVLLVPRAHHSWLEAQIMRTGRIRFMQILQQAGVAERVARLFPQVDDRAVSLPLASALEAIADPERPISPPAFLQNLVGERPRARHLGRLAKAVGIGVAIVAMTLAWRFTPLSAIADPENIRQWFEEVADMPEAPLI